MSFRSQTLGTNSMKTKTIPLPALLVAAALLSGVHSAHAQKGDTKPMLRLINASGPGEARQAVLASRSEDGKWNRFAGMELRGSMVSDWLPSYYGELHILLKQNGKPESVCHFTHPEEARRALVILTADDGGTNYQASVIDPEKEGFTEGTSVIINAAKVSGIVTLGAQPLTVEAGKHLVARPGADENGGYSMMVQYLGENDTMQVCYDRRVITNPKCRNIIVLLPDPTITLRVVTLSEFGPFE